MQEVFRAIGRLSRSSITVLINGQSGTGKELVAHALHKHSPRAHKPFIALNMAAIPKDLIESELFGHEKGRLHRRQQHRATAASSRPTAAPCFSTRSATCRSDVQTRLLRVLADGEFYRVGGHSAGAGGCADHRRHPPESGEPGAPKASSARTCSTASTSSASTSPPCASAARISPCWPALPAEKRRQGPGVEMPKACTPRTQGYLSRLPWPGNVRQLENVCRWLTVMASGQVIEPKDLPRKPCGNAADTAVDWMEALARTAQARLGRGESGILNDLTSEFERTLIRVALAHTGGRKIEAAEPAGLGPQHPDPQDPGTGDGGGGGRVGRPVTGVGIPPRNRRAEMKFGPKSDRMALR
jgi:two-component system nitrogen regulation response regulator GlnG